MKKMKGKKNQIIADLRSENGRLRAVAKVHRKAKKETECRYATDKDGTIRRTDFWKKRSRLMDAVGTNIHGGREGYEMDIRHKVASSARMIDAFLTIGKVQERLGIAVDRLLLLFASYKIMDCSPIPGLNFS